MLTSKLRSADEVQEIIEIGLIPAGATLAVPLNFPELNLMAFYMIYVEAMGEPLSSIGQRSLTLASQVIRASELTGAIR